jgi:single-strand DNA-binding protein
MHHDHVGLNVAVLRGIVSSDPRVRDLPSGSIVTNVEVTTRLDDTTCSVPIVVHDATVTVAGGDDVVVVGHVARRFFRAGGVTQSRTEVVASSIVKASRRRTAERAVGAAIEEISRAA